MVAPHQRNRPAVVQRNGHHTPGHLTRTGLRHRGSDGSTLTAMPVIVVGADSDLGERIVAALLPTAAEVRAFVTDPGAAPGLKQRGVKVAIGDVSDGSHVGGAAINTFCAVIIAAAAVDDRERSFASTPAEVAAAWAEGLAEAGTTRVIWIGDESVRDVAAPVAASVTEFVAVSSTAFGADEIVAEVVRLEALDRLAEPVDTPAEDALDA